MVVDGKSLSNVSYIDILYRCTAMIHTNKNISFDSGDISYGMKYELLMILNYSSNCCCSASIVSVLYQQFKMHFSVHGECAFTALLIHHLDDLQNVLLFCIFMYLG